MNSFIISKCILTPFITVSSLSPKQFARYERNHIHSEEEDHLSWSTILKWIIMGSTRKRKLTKWEDKKNHESALWIKIQDCIAAISAQNVTQVVCILGKGSKNCRNIKKLPFEHDIGCHCVKLFLLKSFHYYYHHYYYRQVLSQFDFLSFVTIWVFEFCHNLRFLILSQFDFLVLSQCEFLTDQV